MSFFVAYYHVTLGILWLMISSSISDNVPKGHLQPLGSHRLKEGYIEMLDYVPYPRDFYYNYVLASRAVIFKGAAKLSKGFELWTDNYLRTHYGEEVVRVDYGKKENRYRSADDMPLAEFLSIYNDTDRYLVDTLPHNMWKEFSLPRCLLCGGFTEALQDTVMWFSSGGTKSHLHNDKVENINCLLSGAKKWFFVDRNNSESIVMDHQDGEYCSVNVDSMNMYKYPFLRDIPWWFAEVQAGDCIYVPYGWAHQVTSLSRNLAVNIWWSPEIIFNDSNCEAPSQKELSNFKFTHGEMLRFQAIQVINRYGGITDFDKINVQIVHEHTGERLITKQRFNLLDSNGDGLLTEHELKGLSTDVIEEAFGHTPPGEVNLVGVSRRDEEDTTLTDIVNNLPDKLPPNIEEFLLRRDKSRHDIKMFLNERNDELPQVLRNYLTDQLTELQGDEEPTDTRHVEF